MCCLPMLRRCLTGLSREIAVRPLHVAYLSALVDVLGREPAGCEPAVEPAATTLRTQDGQGVPTPAAATAAGLAAGSAPSSRTVALNGARPSGGRRAPVQLAALQTWLRSIGLTDWDLQQQWVVDLQPQLRWSLPDLKAWHHKLASKQLLGALPRPLIDLIRQYPRLLVPEKSPGGHLDPGQRERRSWYPHNMLEALELHAGGLPAAVRLLQVVPSFGDHRKYNPVVFAEVAHRLKGLGCSPADIRALVRRQPTLFTPSGYLKRAGPHSWELLEYLVKALGHEPRNLLCHRLPLLESRSVRLPEVQRRVAFMELKGLAVHRKKLFWARQSPAGFCKDLGFSREEYAAFKASVKAGQAGAGIAPNGAGNGKAGSSGSQSGAGSPAGHSSRATSSLALGCDGAVNGAAASRGSSSSGVKEQDGKSRAAAVIAALRNYGRRRDTG